MGEVLIKCTGSRLEDWKKLKNFQGDLKELSKDNYEKLKWRILTKGFKAPFFVWKGHDYLLDGLQRSRALAGLEDDGHTVPARLPVVDIIAETKAEAKDDLLGFVSQYGHPTEEGLYKFLNDVPDLNWDEIVKSVDIPDIDLAQFEEGWIKDGNSKGKETGKASIARTVENLAKEERDVIYKLAGYRTAIQRKSKSKPVRYFEESGLIKGKCLDYGCGMDRHKYKKFDPFYKPDYILLKKKWDTIMCNYVLNVIPLTHNRIELLLTLKHLLAKNGRILVSVWQKDEFDSTTKSGYQSGMSENEWREFFNEWFKGVEKIPISDVWAWSLR